MQTSIDQIMFNADTLEWTLFLSVNHEQTTIFIKAKDAGNILHWIGRDNYEIAHNTAHNLIYYIPTPTKK